MALRGKAKEMPRYQIDDDSSYSAKSETESDSNSDSTISEKAAESLPAEDILISTPTTTSSDSSFKSLPSILRSDWKLAENSMPKCSICQKVFRRPYHLSAHMAVHKAKRTRNKVLNMQMHEENCCPKKKLDKQNDSEVCEWQLMCKICNKRCNDNESLVEHMKVAHKKQRPFFCRLCNCAFGNHSDFYAHLKTQHSSKKPFQCEYRGKSWKKVGMLQSHMMKVHTDENQQPFRCSFCSRSSKGVKEMKVHSNKCHIDIIDLDLSSESSAEEINVMHSASPSPLPMKKIDSNDWKEVQVMIERVDDKTIAALTNEKSSCTLDELVHDDDPNHYDWKEFSIVIKRTDFIERAVENGQKSISLKKCSNALLVEDQCEIRGEERSGRLRSHETNSGEGEGWLTSFLQFFSPIPHA